MSSFRGHDLYTKPIHIEMTLSFINSLPFEFSPVLLKQRTRLVETRSLSLTCNVIGSHRNVMNENRKLRSVDETLFLSSKFPSSTRFLGDLFPLSELERY